MMDGGTLVVVAMVAMMVRQEPAQIDEWSRAGLLDPAGEG
jgi:hypothetical protein